MVPHSPRFRPPCTAPRSTQFGIAGTTFAFNVSTDVMTHCTNWVDVREATAEEQAAHGVLGDGCGGNAFGYGPTGGTWVPL